MIGFSSTRRQGSDRPGKFLKDLGYIDREPGWDKFVNTRFLDEAKKELGIK
jgi:hypothetical protein